jgi:hypothetical protein
MRKFISWLEFWFLLLVQLAMIVTYLTMLFPGGVRGAKPLTPDTRVAAEPSVTTATPQDPATTFKPTKLEAYLNQYPTTKAEAKAIAAQRAEQGWGNTYSIARRFNHKMAYRIAYDAKEKFREDCNAIGGEPEQKAHPQHMAYYYGIERKVPFAYDAVPHMCVRSDGTSLSALFADHGRDRYGDPYVTIYMMTANGASDLKAVYQRAMDKEKQFQDGMRQREAELEGRYRANMVIWTQWRKILEIGSDTNCGPVIGLRGPMVEVANNAQALWFKRDALFPVGAMSATGAPIRCGSTSSY